MQTARAAALPRFMLAWFAIQGFFFTRFSGGQKDFCGPKSFPQKIDQFRQGLESLRLDIPTTRGDRNLGWKNTENPGWIYPPQPDGCEVPHGLNEFIVVVDGSILGGGRSNVDCCKNFLVCVTFPFKVNFSGGFMAGEPSNFSV